MHTAFKPVAVQCTVYIQKADGTQKYLTLHTPDRILFCPTCSWVKQPKAALTLGLIKTSPQAKCHKIGVVALVFILLLII